MESMYKALLFYDIVKCVTEYLDNKMVRYESKHEVITNDITKHKTTSKITFKMSGNKNIEVVHNMTDDVVYIVSYTNAFSFVVFSKDEIIKLISR